MGGAGTLRCRNARSIQIIALTSAKTGVRAAEARRDDVRSAGSRANRRRDRGEPAPSRRETKRPPELRCRSPQQAKLARESRSPREPRSGSGSRRPGRPRPVECQLAASRRPHSRDRSPRSGAQSSLSRAAATAQARATLQETWRRGAARSRGWHSCGSRLSPSRNSGRYHFRQRHAVPATSN
jgi:hypothetical protein